MNTIAVHTHTSHRERICLCENVCCLEPHKRWIHFEWKEINSFMQPTSKTIHTSANFLLTTTNWLDNWFGFVYSPADIAHCSLCACVRVFSIVSLALHSYYLEFFIRALKTLLERARASIQTHTYNERHFSTSLEIIIIYECDGVCVCVCFI